MSSRWACGRLWLLLLVGLAGWVSYGYLFLPVSLADSPLVSSGYLAYIGGDGNVYVTTPELTSKIAVTDDATAAAEYPGYSYHRLSWSPDGRLAFAGVTRQDSQTRGRLFVADQPGGPIRQIGQSDDHFVIYIYWAPSTCPNRPDCQQLAYLIEEAESISLRLVELEAETIKNRLIGAGRPFYFSWSPDGRQMLWHTGGAYRYNQAARLTLYDLLEQQPQELAQRPGLFLAPAWSPQGDEWLAVSAQEDQDQLHYFGDQRAVSVAKAPAGQMVFAWSPQGDQVAYAVRQNPNDPFYGPVYLFDRQSGQTQRLTAGGFAIEAFFWSPDGQRLAYLTHQPLFDATWMQWRVYDLAKKKDRGFKMFHPSFQMQFIIASFNQYAQSDRFWSPDSRYLVYADSDKQLVERVWLVDTWDQNGHNTTLVDTGAIGLWSFH